MAHVLPDLPYAFDALEPHIDAKTMEIHHGKHHAGYVAKLNAALEGTGLEDKDVNELLKHIGEVPEDKRQAVINNGGGHANHSLFWQVMTPSGENAESFESLMNAMKDSFGSGEACHEKFVEAAKSHFGSGWVWMVVNPETRKLEIMTTKNQDSPLMEGKTPILGLDVWEHSYYLNYQNRRPEYIDAFVKVINWGKVSELYEEAMK